ncbi:MULTISPECIES: hypothetical protein [Halorussus]|uniref:hypothetical protein n=1 Tax=Halorussus TaxID=1070314 RepID=UPI0020A075AA|nr:hypothetical protein [Halorussus vallis]USZ74268.1 hypothetical protein NGM07_12535 [Halorussus vallis]
MTGEPAERAKSDADASASDSARPERPTRARFWLTNDLLALTLNVSLVGVVAAGGAGVLDLAAVPVEIRLTYLTVAGGSTVWTFGQAAFETWAAVRCGDAADASAASPRTSSAGSSRVADGPSRSADRPPRNAGDDRC